MGIGIYLQKGVSDTFDVMEKLGIKKVNKIINELRSIYVNAPMFTQVISLSKEKVTVKTLKEVLENKFTEKDLAEFVKIFENTSGKKPYQFGKVGKEEEESGKKVPGVGNLLPLITAEEMQKNKTKILSIPIKFTDDFWMMLDKIDDKVAWSIIELEQNSDVKNRLGIEKIDVSDSEYYFDIFTNGRKSIIKIGEFIRAYLPAKFSKGETYDFIQKYNKILSKLGSAAAEAPENVIKVPPFVFNPKDVRATFISLVTETYPDGTEDMVVKYLPQDLSKDKFGNYYKIIGNSDTVFTSHLDTACRKQEPVTLVSMMKSDQEIIMTDGTTILGADDKAGVTVMLYMMAHNIPGIYYFFLGEEVGGVGSGKVADNFLSFPFLKGAKKMVSFDRRNYYSVITSQYGAECCSDEFAQSLCDEMNTKGGLKLNLDPTGVFTDSANFVEYIPECTNVSVGYFNEHTHNEIQNMNYLIRLAEACVKVDWANLVIARKVGFDDATLQKWQDLIQDLKDLAFYNDMTIKGISGKIIMELEFDDISFVNAYEDFANIESVLKLHKCNPDITFDGNKIKINIK